MRYMKGQIMSGQSDKLKGVNIVEHMDSEQHHAVKLKGLPIRSVHTLVDGYQVTATKPEDAETLRKIIGCGVVLECVLECIPPVIPKEAKPVLSGTASFIPGRMYTPVGFKSSIWADSFRRTNSSRWTNKFWRRAQRKR